ncbi:phosphomethylpyrimidine synthase ThiC [Pedobacter sp. D749]|uniref:phosphomethylpyrimidine synthase ThiC n=1 Tax=Pedobacter sp. D749 TaxID=2856523 RepID=UPI001C57912E|nr:phosphomethylpyrimidine synthase ThiC [Pedobacter sp. D749]QXU42799.1 phosphomethylpyrimidine synthase ThiC [Pedobacter sp. D749]
MEYSSLRTIQLKNKLRTKASVNLGGDHPTALGVLLGITQGQTSLEKEIEKATLCEKYGVSTITDLSTDGTNDFRLHLINNASQAIGTVPVYEFYYYWNKSEREQNSISEQLIKIFEKQALEGVDFFSIQASLSSAILNKLNDSNRVIPITSRGGAMMAELMTRFNIENPLLSAYDTILDICSSYNITLSLVGSLRPGTIADSFNELHLEELNFQMELAQRAAAKNVQVMIELINHVPLNQLEKYCKLSHEVFGGLPYGALGPTPTDIAVDYDDVAGAIAAAQVVGMGISWINLVTSAEHSYFPVIQDLERALKYYQIAFHVGNISRYNNIEQDFKLSKNRNLNNWQQIAKYSIFPEESSEKFNRLGYKIGQGCNLCDKQCPLVRTKIVEKRINKILEVNPNCKYVKHNV